MCTAGGHDNTSNHHYWGATGEAELARAHHHIKSIEIIDSFLSYHYALDQNQSDAAFTL
jgi:hypothetical protein